jgi:catecholate siderophore receptor
MYENSNRFRDHSTIERYGVAPTATLLAGSTMLRFGYEHFNDSRTVDRGLPSFEGRPSEAAITTFFGDPAASDSRMRVDGASATIERAFASGMAIRSTSRLASYDKYYQNVYPGAMNAAGTSVSMLAYRHTMGRDNWFTQTDFTAPFSVAGIGHNLLAGFEIGRQVTTNFRETGFFDNETTSILVPFAQPTFSSNITFRQRPADADNRTVTSVASMYLQDQVTLASWLQAVAGVRYERLIVRTTDVRADRLIARDDDVVSPRFGLIARVVEPLTIYGSYSLSYLPGSGDQMSSLTPSNQTLAPERFVNREVGAKWDITSEINLSAAIYRLERTNTASPDPADPSRLVQTGAQQSEGVEVGLTGDLTSAWSVAAGFTSQRAVITSRTSGAKEGSTVPLVPRRTLSLWNKYQVSRLLGAGLGVIHQAEMFAAIDNAVTLPGFTRVDVGVFLAIRPTLQAQVNVENALGTRYYSTSHGNNNIMPGAPRTLRLTLTAGR